MATPKLPPEPEQRQPDPQNARTEPARIEPDAAHVPMTEEFDSFRHTMPNMVPIAIAMLIVVAILGSLAWIFRAKPVASGTIDDAYAVTIPGSTQSLAIVNVTFHNLTKEPLRLMNASVTTHAKGADFTDSLGSIAEYNRYFQAFPALQEHARTPLNRDLRVAPNQSASGYLIVALPVSQQEFDARDNLTVTLSFAGERPAKITSGKKQ